jgi:hypothetical protein
MDSRRKTGVEDVRPVRLSRRAVIAGTSVAAFGAARPVPAAPTLPVALATVDETTRHCREWLAVNAKIARLQTRWAKLEGWLIRNHSWCKLTPAEQQALPWSRELRDIDGCLDLLFERRERLLESIPDPSEPSLEAVIMRLAVVEREIWPEDHPEAHALIRKSRQELVAISQGRVEQAYGRAQV